MVIENHFWSIINWCSVYSRVKNYTKCHWLYKYIKYASYLNSKAMSIVALAFILAGCGDDIDDDFEKMMREWDREIEEKEQRENPLIDNIDPSNSSLAPRFLYYLAHGTKIKDGRLKACINYQQISRKSAELVREMGGSDYYTVSKGYLAEVDSGCSLIDFSSSNLSGIHIHNVSIQWLNRMGQMDNYRGVIENSLRQYLNLADRLDSLYRSQDRFYRDYGRKDHDNMLSTSIKYLSTISRQLAQPTKKFFELAETQMMKLDALSSQKNALEGIDSFSTKLQNSSDDRNQALEKVVLQMEKAASDLEQAIASPEKS